MYRVIVIIVGFVLIGFVYNWFLIFYKVLSSGISGIVMIIGILMFVSMGIMNFLLNLFFLIIGFMKLGKWFVLYMLLFVVVLLIVLYVIFLRVVSIDFILLVVFGGVLIGIGVGFVFC